MVSAVRALLCVLALSQSVSAFRFGFSRLSLSIRNKNVEMRSVAQTQSSQFYETMSKFSVDSIAEATRSVVLERFQAPVQAAVYPAIGNSPHLIAKFPDPCNRTVQNILGGLSDVTDIEYLNTLPVNDPRRHLLATIQDPGPERRAELIENLQAIDAERGDAAQKESTYSVYQYLSREGIDKEMLKVFEDAAEEETLRRQRPEFSEYENPYWYAGFHAQQLLQFLETCFEIRENCIFCKHPSLSVWFPYYNATDPQPRSCYSLAELYALTKTHGMPQWLLQKVFDQVVYPAIAESELIAMAYPDPVDRTPHKLLGGLGNIVSIEYMQSLEPHDPRRLFLDTMNPPSEERRLLLEMNALLVDRAVMARVQCEPGVFSLRSVLQKQVRNDLEENYLTTLRSAKLSEQLRYYVKNNGTDNEDGKHHRKMIAKTDQFRRDTETARKEPAPPGKPTAFEQLYLINRVNML